MSIEACLSDLKFFTTQHLLFEVSPDELLRRIDETFDESPARPRYQQRYFKSMLKCHKSFVLATTKDDDYDELNDAEKYALKAISKIRHLPQNEKSKREADAYHVLAKVHYYQGRLKDAQSDILKSIKLDGGNILSLITAAEISCRRKDYQQAQGVLTDVSFLLNSIPIKAYLYRFSSACISKLNRSYIDGLKKLEEMPLPDLKPTRPQSLPMARCGYSGIAFNN
jgi:tetratricopeptide (TPR) repeat protein